MNEAEVETSEIYTDQSICTAKQALNLRSAAQDILRGWTSLPYFNVFAKTKSIFPYTKVQTQFIFSY